MQTMSTESVVDQMINELAARRRTTAARRAAYLALARVIVYGEEQQRTPLFDWESATAA
jgi:hypothetical protein